MAHFLCHLGCSHFGALLLDFYFTENNLITFCYLKKLIWNCREQRMQNMAVCHCAML